MGVNPSKKHEQAALQTHNAYEPRGQNACGHATSVSFVAAVAAAAAAQSDSESRDHVAPASAAAHVESSHQTPPTVFSSTALSVELPQSPTMTEGAAAAAIASHTLCGTSDFTADLPRSNTHGNLSKLLNQRRASASSRRFSGAAAASSDAAAASASASPAQSRRCSVVGLRPEERVSSAAVLQWQRDTQARAEAHTAATSPASAAATTLSSEGRKRSVSSSSAQSQAASSRSGSPPIRYGVHASNSLRSSMSLSNLSSFGSVHESPEFSQRSSHRLHVSTLLAHCANCGRLHRGEVLVLLKDGGHIHCSKECYWSSRLRRGNFDDHAEEEGAELECDSASVDACGGLQLDSEPPSPRGRVVIDDGTEERSRGGQEELLDELDCKKRQIELTLGADFEAASEIPSGSLRQTSNTLISRGPAAPAAAACAALADPKAHVQPRANRSH